MNKMEVEIWSDIMCPFCYIGKRNFEAALSQFIDKEQIKVVWKSFQLDASIPEIAGETHQDYLVKRKGLNVDQVQSMLQNVTMLASQVGLVYDFEKSRIVNSLKAHQLVHFAKKQGKDDEAEEVLFKAFFTDGKNIADTETLLELAKTINLDITELKVILDSNQLVKSVEQDIDEARKIGVSGVPFFVFNHKYAVSGAQPIEVFLDALNESFAEWNLVNPKVEFIVTNGQSCGIDQVCD